MFNFGDSANGQGRTLWEILTGKNKRAVVKPFNPLEYVAKKTFLNINSLDFSQLDGINFLVTDIIPTFFLFDNIGRRLEGVDYNIQYGNLNYVIRYEGACSSGVRSIVTLFEVIDEFKYDNDFNEIFEQDDTFHVLEDREGKECNDVFPARSDNIFKAEIDGDIVSYREYCSENVEHLVIERNERTKMFRILRGYLLTTDHITSF